MELEQTAIKLYEYNFDKPELSEEVLEHFGVKGMKWGVRRYQNYDGTRIGSNKRNKKRKIVAMTQQYTNKKTGETTTKVWKGKEYEKERNKRLKDRNDINRKKIAEMNFSPELYSTKEINDTLNRISAESRLNDMDKKFNPTTKDKVKDMVKKVTGSKAFKATAVSLLAAGVITGLTIHNLNKESGRNKVRISKNDDIIDRYLKDYNKIDLGDIKNLYKNNLYDIVLDKIFNGMGINQFKNKVQ